MGVDRDLLHDPTIAAGEVVRERIHDVAESIVLRVHRVMASQAGAPGTTNTPETVAERFVTLLPDDAQSGEYYIQLAGPNCTPILFGPFHDPILALDQVESIRQFLAAVIRTADGGPVNP